MMPTIRPEAPPKLAQPTACVGIFDSGVGGLSILRALRKAMPSVPMLYVADSGHAPYGEKSEVEVQARSHAIARYLLAEGARGLVIACNTATAAAVHSLRADFPELPIIGIEPGIKPALECTRNGQIGVLATPGTLASDKFRRLVAAQAGAAAIVARPCPGLADLIEQGNLAAPALRALIGTHCDALRQAGVDTVVLGCTHYAFVSHHIQDMMGTHVRVIDTAEAVARHALSRLAPVLAGMSTSPFATRLRSSGNPARLAEIASSWLPFACECAALPPR